MVSGRTKQIPCETLHILPVSDSSLSSTILPIHAIMYAAMMSSAARKCQINQISCVVDSAEKLRDVCGRKIVNGTYRRRGIRSGISKILQTHVKRSEAVAKSHPPSSEE